MKGAKIFFKVHRINILDIYITFDIIKAPKALVLKDKVSN